MNKWINKWINLSKIRDPFTVRTGFGIRVAALCSRPKRFQVKSYNPAVAIATLGEKITTSKKKEKIEIPSVQQHGNSQQLGSCAASVQQQQLPSWAPWLHLRTPNCTSMLIILVASLSAPPHPTLLPSARMQCYCFWCLSLSFPLPSLFSSSFSLSCTLIFSPNIIATTFLLLLFDPASIPPLYPIFSITSHQCIVFWSKIQTQ